MYKREAMMSEIRELMGVKNGMPTSDGQVSLRVVGTPQIII